jgi:sugar phosphate isomerase/epimerase
VPRLLQASCIGRREGAEEEAAPAAPAGVGLAALAPHSPPPLPPSQRRQMARAGTWGDELTLRAVSEALATVVNVISSGGPRSTACVWESVWCGARDWAMTD